MLYYYNQSRFSNDTIANITKKYEKCGFRQKTHLSIIRQLLEQNIINESQYNDFIKVKQQPEHLKETKNIIQNQIDLEETSIDDGIRILRDYLCKDNKTKFVLWLQKVLIDTCYVKLALSNPGEFDNGKALEKPVTYYFARTFQKFLISNC